MNDYTLVPTRLYASRAHPIYMLARSRFYAYANIGFYTSVYSILCIQFYNSWIQI